MEGFISFRASDADKARLNVLAAKAGVSSSELLRSMVRTIDVRAETKRVLTFTNNNAANTSQGDGDIVVTSSR